MAVRYERHGVKRHQNGEGIDQEMRQQLFANIHELTFGTVAT